MRPSQQLRATVKSAARYLEANAPTGLTGLPTHPSPRPALLYTYSQTLRKLKQLPKSSVYRQSCEALTRHRMKILEETKPPGHEEWLQRVTKAIEADPDAYSRFKRDDGSLAHEENSVQQKLSWDGLVTKSDARREGPGTETEAAQKIDYVVSDVTRTDKEAQEGVRARVSDLEVEPALTADQVSELENKIGAGLIEEVLQVAEGELILVDEMLASRAWEDLEEKSPPGQWEYFERGDRV